MDGGDEGESLICISEDATLIASLEIAKSRIPLTMIDKGMDNDNKMLQGLVDIADNRIAQIKSGEKPALKPDDNASILLKWWLIWTRLMSRHR